MPETRHQQAVRHVNRGRQIVARQRVLVDQMHRRSADTTAAENLLVAFERSLDIFEGDLAQLERRARRDV